MTGDFSIEQPCPSDDAMDALDNCSKNETIVTEAPKAELLDYAEIGLLSFMVMVGGPVNVLCFLRSLRFCLRPDIPFSSASANVGQRAAGRRRNSSWAVTPRLSSRSVTLRLHLTAANLLIIWIYGLSQISWLATYRFLGGDMMCRLIKFFHTFCFYLTSNIIVSIAIDRVYVTAYIDRPPRSPAPGTTEHLFRFAFCWIPWVLAFVSSVPQVFVWNVIAPYKELPNWYQCVTIWVSWKVDHSDQIDRFGEEFIFINLQESAYSISHLILVFWCPAFIVVCSYAVIVARFRQKIVKTQLETRRLQRSANVEQFRTRAAKLYFRTVLTSSESTDLLKKSDSNPAGRMTGVPIVISVPQIFLNAAGNMSTNVAIHTLSRVRRRTIRASACISFSYIACWAPYNFLEMWRFFDPSFENRSLELLSNLIVLNAVINPWIYGI